MSFVLSYISIIRRELIAIRREILDTLFPVHCISCKKYGDWICGDCFEKISINIEQVCPICKKSITPDGKTCFNCRKKYAIDGILVSSAYKIDGKKTLLAKIIHYYKYRFISELKTCLGEILKKAILGSSLPLPDAIIPVPLHSRRLRWRGFNQSEMLSDYLAVHIAPGLEIPVLKKTLIRKKYTIPQMRIKNHHQRKDNIKGAFSIDRKNILKIKGKNILLVDDIATTGSTMLECAKTLKKRNAKKVYGIVLARE